MNTEHMDVRRGEIMLELNRYVLWQVSAGRGYERSEIQHYRTPPQLSNLTSPTIARNMLVAMRPISVYLWWNTTDICREEKHENHKPRRPL